MEIPYRSITRTPRILVITHPSKIRKHVSERPRIVRIEQ